MKDACFLIQNNLKVENFDLKNNSKVSVTIKTLYLRKEKHTKMCVGIAYESNYNHRKINR